MNVFGQGAVARNVMNVFGQGIATTAFVRRAPTFH